MASWNRVNVQDSSIPTTQLNRRASKDDRAPILSQQEYMYSDYYQPSTQ